MQYSPSHQWNQLLGGPAEDARRRSRFFVVGMAVWLCCALSGCSRWRQQPALTYVYVTAKQTFLRDRVAAVSNRTGTVSNGERLEVLERERRWLKVRAPQGEVGWIEERQTASQKLEDQFEALRQGSQSDPVIATATTSDEAYLHVAPGRETDHLYLLPESTPLSLLKRASVPKPVPPGSPPPETPAPATALAGTMPPPPRMEDWWLIRDAKGETGWIYGGLVDVSAPDALLRYADGQRIVSAYVLAKVDDPDSGVLENGKIVTSIPEYLTVMAPYKSGLPYDFNQVRVFVWNLRKHRYETGFAEHNIAGYLPLKITLSADPYGHGAEEIQKLPTFTYRVLAAGEPLPVPDPATGLFKPGRTVEETWRLEGNICRRVLPPGVLPPAEAHPETQKKIESRTKRRRF
ncbi:MAG: SH3 domain-containing protein [Acidobacteriaceae bacterium]